MLGKTRSQWIERELSFVLIAAIVVLALWTTALDVNGWSIYLPQCSQVTQYAVLPEMVYVYLKMDKLYC